MKKTDEEYKKLSKGQLIKKLMDIKETLHQMKLEKDSAELASLPWLGNLGQWQWTVESNTLLFNKKKALNLGYLLKEIPETVGHEYFTEMLHPEDFERVMKNMEDHLLGLSDGYEVEYRIRKKDGSYVWYYDRGKVTHRDSKGKALQVSGIVFDISVNKEMQTELKKSNELLHQLSITDELTGAYNRRYMIKEIHQAIKNSSMKQEKFSLIMLDIDNFKGINDTYGHNMGDIVLQNISDLLRLNIRQNDLLARWGGEEFIILLKNTSVQEAIIIAETTRIQINNLKLRNVRNVSASFGVITYYEGDSLDDTIQRVDAKMYKAKDQGKNQVVYQLFEYLNCNSNLSTYSKTII